MAGPKWLQITPEEFAGLCADYGLEIRSAGSRWWVHTRDSRRRGGEIKTPAEAIAFVKGYKTQGGIQILAFKQSTTSDRYVKIGYSREGYLALRAEERSQRAWKRLVGGALRREPT